MVNIAEILKDCPKGTKLYSPICGDCRLIKIYDGLGFDVINDTDDVFNFSYDGRYHLNGECCIFPSNENRDWNTFQKPFKDGDILTYKGNYTTTFIYRNKDNEPHLSTSFYVACNDAPSHNFLIYNKYTLIALNENCDVRLATEDEKIKLFDAIKTNGYKWNVETKTLENLIIPKFKVGDQIVKKNGISNSYIVNSVSSIYYGLRTPDGTGIDVLFVDEQDEWYVISRNFNDGDIIAKDERELVPVPKFKVGDRIKRKTHDIKYRIINVENDAYFVERCADNFTCHMSFKYVDDEYELVPNKFDINTLKSFESKVLVRDVDHHEWEAAIFGRYNGEKVFVIGGNDWYQCIPFEGNEHLYGTTNDCDEFYKNW